MMDPLKVRMMVVAKELGKGLDEIAHWEASELFEWVAFLNLQAKAERDALQNAQNKPGSSRKFSIVN